MRRWQREGDRNSKKEKQRKLTEERSETFFQYIKYSLTTGIDFKTASGNIFSIKRIVGERMIIEIFHQNFKIVNHNNKPPAEIFSS